MWNFCLYGPDHNASKGLCQIVHVVERDICGVNEQIGIASENLVGMGANRLAAKNIFIVGDFWQMFLNIGVKIHSSIKGIKQAQDMDFLTGTKFHAGDHRQPQLLSRAHDCRTVLAGVVIGHSDDIQADEEARPAMLAGVISSSPQGDRQE